MTKASRVWAAALAALMATPIAPTSAQFSPFPDPPPPAAPAPAEPPSAPAQRPKAPAAPRGPNVAGAWAGELTQLGRDTPYKFTITIAGSGGQTHYPELKCTGKLIRIGASRSYVFFIEVITEGRAEKGGRCPDGTINVGRAGNNLAVGWFGSIQGQVVVAQGMLTRRSGQ